jgi:hypothetical protein
LSAGNLKILANGISFIYRIKQQISTIFLLLPLTSFFLLGSATFLLLYGACPDGKAVSSLFLQDSTTLHVMLTVQHSYPPIPVVPL